MDRGIVVIAHNTSKWNYFKMAEAVAARAAKFLHLPTTVITDSSSVTSTTVFDSVVLKNPDKSNYRQKNAWYNKDRFRVFELSPYSDTLVLDTDYMINSGQLLSTFDIDTDFCCHGNIRWLFEHNDPEWLHTSNVKTLWATVIRFKKTKLVEQIFDTMAMVQENYSHYSNIYKFLPYMYRNDYALTIALKTVYGHLPPPECILPWNLNHIGDSIGVTRLTSTDYKLIKKDKTTQKSGYMVIKDFDFHMLDKANYMQLI